MKPIQDILDQCSRYGMKAPYTVTMEGANGQRVVRLIGEDFERLLERPSNPQPVELPWIVTVEDARGQNRVFDVQAMPDGSAEPTPRMH